MDQIQLTNSFAETPKDGNWYRLPSLNDELARELSEFIRWDKGKSRWDWMMLKDDIIAIDVSFIPEFENCNDS